MAQGFTQEDLADQLGLDRTTVGRWERGETSPYPRIRPKLCHLLKVSAIELDALLASEPAPAGGLMPTPDSVPGWAASTEQTIAAANELWAHGIQQHAPHQRPYMPSAATHAAFHWHFAPAPDAPARTEGIRLVGTGDVEHLHRARLDFIALDRVHGGGHSFTWLLDYLGRTLPPLLAGRYPRPVGRELFAAASALTELGGWMAFDQDRVFGQGLAQRFFIQALSLAHQSGDRAYAAHILSNLATQALFLNHGSEAARLARAARSGAGRAATQTLVARLAVVEARGWGLLGDRREARAAIRRAETAMTQSRPEADPTWLITFTPAHHAGSIMHALRDLGLFNDAAQHADAALALPASNVRTRALHQTLLATVHIGRGDLDAACATGHQALSAYPHLTSARLRERLRDLNRRLKPHHAVGCVRDYRERARELLTQ